MRTQPCDIVTKKERRRTIVVHEFWLLVAIFPWFMVPVIFNMACIFSVHQFLTHCYILVKKIHWLSDTLLYFS